MIEINGNKYVFVPDYEARREGCRDRIEKHLETESPQQFCDKIAEAGSSFDCYRLEEKEGATYFNINVRSREEIFLPLSSEHYIAEEHYGLAWFLMPWGDIYIHSCGAGPGDSYYFSYTWSKLSSIEELKQGLFGGK